MNDQEHILDVYGTVAMVTGQMVDAAKSSNWDHLTSLEQECRLLITKLKTSDGKVPPDAQFAQRKASLIRQVLADDAEVRKFTEPWMAKVEAYLGSVRRTTRLSSAYQAGPE